MTGLLGKPRSGKTTLLLKLILEILKKKGRILVIDPDGAEATWDNPKFTRYEDIKDVPDNFKGCAVVYYSGKEAHGTPTFPYIMGQMDRRANGNKRGPWTGVTYILDDANVYARGQLEDALEWLLMRKRQYGCDIVTTAHSWGEVSPMFLRFIDVYGIGITSGHPSERSDVIKGDALKRTVDIRNEVNEIRRNDPNAYPFKFITKDGYGFSGSI